jgi:rRNA maturation protein Nop10
LGFNAYARQNLNEKQQFHYLICPDKKQLFVPASGMDNFEKYRTGTPEELWLEHIFIAPDPVNLCMHFRHNPMSHMECTNCGKRYPLAVTKCSSCGGKVTLHEYKE